MLYVLRIDQNYHKPFILFGFVLIDATVSLTKMTVVASFNANLSEEKTRTASHLRSQIAPTSKFSLQFWFTNSAFAGEMAHLLTRGTLQPSQYGPSDSHDAKRLRFSGAILCLSPSAVPLG